MHESTHVVELQFSQWHHIYPFILQIKKTSGGWIDVPYMENALLVNLGAFMEQWTSGRYLATVSVL